MFGDPFLDAFLGSAAFGLICFLFRYRIMAGALKTLFVVLPHEAMANMIERAASAYIKKEEVDDGKGRVAVKYVPTPRLKAMAEVVAPVILAAVMAQLRKVKIDPAQLAGAAQGAGVDLGSLAGSLFAGGGGKKGGGIESMLPMLLQGFLSGGGQGGGGPAKQAPRTGGPPG